MPPSRRLLHVLRYNDVLFVTAWLLTCCWRADSSSVNSWSTISGGGVGERNLFDQMHCAWCHVCMRALMHVHTNAIYSSSCLLSVIRVKQTQLWHRVRNWEDNRGSAGRWNVNDNGSIFVLALSVITNRNTWLVNLKTWLRLSTYWDKCCDHGKLGQDILFWVTSNVSKYQPCWSSAQYHHNRNNISRGETINWLVGWQKRKRHKSLIKQQDEESTVMPAALWGCT